MAAHPPPGAFSSPGAVPAAATDPVINHTTDKDPIVIHEDHHEPAPIPAQAAEGAPIHQNPTAAALAALPPKAKQEDVPVVAYDENDPRDTTTSAMYRAPGPPHPPVDANVVDTSNPPGDDGVQLVEGIDNRDLYALVRRFNTVSLLPPTCTYMGRLTGSKSIAFCRRPSTFPPRSLTCACPTCPISRIAPIPSSPILSALPLRWDRVRSAVSASCSVCATGTMRPAARLSTVRRTLSLGSSGTRCSPCASSSPS